MWRVAGDTDSEDEESEYESEEAHLPAGQASVSWLRRGETANEDVARLRVLDRQLMLGDVVARADGGGDSGQVRMRCVMIQARVKAKAIPVPRSFVRRIVAPKGAIPSDAMHSLAA